MPKKPTPSSIKKRLKEFQTIGREAFLRHYANGFGARAHFIRYQGRPYDMKAVWAAAHEPNVPCSDFNTSEPYAALRKLGFRLIAKREAKKLKDRTPNLKTKSTLHIVHGDSDQDRNDLISLAKNKKERNWIVPKRAVVGDKVIVFVNSSFFATAKIRSQPKKRKNWRNRYRAMIGSVRLISPAISIGIIREQIPELVWGKYPRNIHTPELRIARKIQHLIGKRVRWKGRDIVQRGTTSARRAKLNYSELKRLALGHARPFLKKRIGRRTYRIASLIIHELVLRRAGGICEGCSQDAPFLRVNGTPYLEPHHTLHRADDGPDHPDTVIALCPTCHSRVHHAQNGKHFNELLERRLRTTIKERDEELSD